MFVVFESSDAKKKEAVLNKRLMLLRCAYLKGYFDERGSEPMPEIIADGVNPSVLDACKCPTGFMDEDCPKCNPLINNVLHGQVPSWASLDNSIKRLAEQEQRLREAEAIESVCPSCAGFGQRLGQDGKILGICPTCKGSCFAPNRAPKCQHRKTGLWPGGKTVCLYCGEIIGRDLEAGEVT
ncbi:hypothetical protein LCGC14_2852160 [marine sediment metagenome]|uniref:Uncharacterized protein n=1 Tax=marine sediment metagenome TaxID=412755 RepID=A0A0F9AGE2_9ZZZZ